MTPTWPLPHLAPFAAALPFEHLLRKRTAAEAMARWRSEAQAYGTSSLECRVALLLCADASSPHAVSTLASWALQTWHDAPWILVGSHDEPWREQREQAGLPAPIGSSDHAASSELVAMGISWVVPAVPGDLFHPSLAGTIAMASMDGCRAVAWDWLDTVHDAGEIRPLTRRRAPFRDTVAELQQDIRGRAFALPASAWQGHPRHDAWRNRMRDRDIVDDCRVHPEPLAMYLAPATAPVGAEALDVAEQLWGVPFGECPQGSPWPAQPATGVSVLVMYRDRLELTLRAIASVAAQRLPGALELILVNNRSTPETRAAVLQGLQALSPGIATRHIDCPEPFNHSRQARLGAEAASGEVLVFLNNDAELVDADALDRLSRWARLDGIASVGVRMVDLHGNVSGGGFRARRSPGAEFNSPVEEAVGAAGARSRHTVGNTFACAAVSARAFLQLGGLDEVRFPTGYNDVEYCLRAALLGWRHLNLAQARAHHVVGASRERQDEIAQKIALRRRHPWVALHALQEFDEEPVVLPAVPLLLPAGGAAQHPHEVSS